LKRALTIFGAMLAITITHYLTPPAYFLWHEILERLYYLPIIFAAVSFGWIGGLAAAAFAGICYAPHIIMAWNDSPRDLAGKYAEIVVFIAVGAVTGVLADRERKRAHELRVRKIRASLESSQVAAQSGTRDPQSAGEP
jgi:glucose-6-phosphate-specific signal transduction histidine kinase